MNDFEKEIQTPPNFGIGKSCELCIHLDYSGPLRCDKYKMVIYEMDEYGNANDVDTNFYYCDSFKSSRDDRTILPKKFKYVHTIEVVK